jgi:hypothetical protein
MSDASRSLPPAKLAPDVLSTPQNQMPTPATNSNSPTRNPLDSLLIQQLEQLIARERVLQQQYSRLAADPNPRAPIASFAAELTQLELRADRLCRMIDAMN